MNRKLLVGMLIMPLALAINSRTVLSQTTWDGGGTGNNWFTADNWDTNVVPNGISEDVIVGSPSPTVANSSVNINSLMVDVDGELTLNASLNFDFGGSASTTLVNMGSITTSNNSDFQLSGMVVNSGTIETISTGSFSDLEVVGTGATLSGGGTITLSGLANARINGIGGALLTIVDQTINGLGNIGTNSTTIDIMAGSLVDANSMGDTLNVDPAPAGLTNAGTMQASDGGNLRIDGFGGGAFDNTGGTISALAGSTVTLDAGATVQGGVIESVADGMVIVPTSQNVFLSDLTLDADVQVGNNTDFGVAGMINNTGSIQMNSSGSSTDIEVQAEGVTFDGAGTIVLGDAAINNRIVGVSSPMMVVLDQTIEGRGNIGGNTMSIQIDAGNLIDANSSGNTLNVDPDPNGLANAGIMRASSGGNLRIDGFGGGIFNNTGVIEALAGSTITLDANANVVGGEIRSVGDGMVVVPTSQSVFVEDLTLDAMLQVNNNTDFGVTGTINNTGTISMVSTGSITSFEVQSGGATLTGGGTVSLENNINSRIDGLGNPLLTIEDQDIVGLGNIGANTISIQLDAGNLIDANSMGNTLNVDPNSSGMTNDGTMQASNGGNLRIDGFGGGEIDNTNGLIQALAGSTVTLDANATVFGGQIVSVGTGSVVVPTSQNVFLSNLTLDADVQVGNNTDFGLEGTITNLGNIDMNSTGSNTDIEIQTGGATITGGGTISLNGINSRFDGPGTMTMQGGTLRGIGRVDTDSIFDGVTMAPGLSIGTLTFNSNPQLMNNSVFEIELSAANAVPGTSLDQFIINGTVNCVNCSGTIMLKTLDAMGNPGMLADFDPSQDYVFRFALADGVVGFNPNNFSVDTSQFANAFTGVFSITSGPVGSDEAIYVKYGQYAVGDVNQDGSINLLDVEPFVDELSNGGTSTEADINCDGSVNLLDVAPFINLLAG